MININPTQYDPSTSAVFWITRNKWGEFSNFHREFPLQIPGFDLIPSIEHIYQALKFPHDSNLQQKILQAETPKECKTIARQRYDIREDWDKVRMPIMYWCVGLKTLQHERFREILVESADLPIVEFSKKDDFWGAKPQPDGSLLGTNALGKIISLVRTQFEMNPALKRLYPLPIVNFTLLDQPIPVCIRPT